MKKIIVAMIIGTSSLFAFNWNTFSAMFKKTIDSISYTVETSGYNPRVYEFDTQGYPRLHCVVLLRNNTRTAPAMQCVETNPKYIKMNEKLK